ncbi:MAG: ChbG/HpnK family deacetylase [Planctomycetaceae bacterium]|jgi:predicted glycoside hydrolase/deacetylase ChbG (UPF0249 family)|nr:ChbG/HpnK family deacetylase [Planctomycetaceae bacterium]
MSKIKKLIINADDLGFSPAVNSAILSGAVAGNITAASLMVNMPFAEEAVINIHNKCNTLSMGLHFTLTSGQPVTEPQKITFLVDSRGMFRLSFGRLLMLLRSKKREQLLQQIQMEFSAQMERMEYFATKYNFRFDHIDSHQHVHVLSGIFDKVQKESTSRKLLLRIPREYFGGFKRTVKRFHQWFPQGFMKRIVLNCCLQSTKQKTGYFGILESGKMDNISLQEIIIAIETGKCNFDNYEINIHPSDFSVSQNDNMLCCSPDDYRFHHSPCRMKEFHALQDGKFQDMIKKFNIKLTDFSDTEI